MLLLPHMPSPPLLIDSTTYQGWLWSRGWYSLTFALVAAVGRPDNWVLDCGMEAEMVRALLLLADQTICYCPSCGAGAGMTRGFSAPVGIVGSPDCTPGPRCGAQLDLCWASPFLVLWQEKAGIFLFVCFVFCFVGPLVVLGSRSLWHLRPGVNGRERNPVNSPQVLTC